MLYMWPPAFLMRGPSRARILPKIRTGNPRTAAMPCGGTHRFSVMSRAGQSGLLRDGSHRAGKETAMVVPSSELCSTHTRPPWRAAISHTRDRPSPTPPHSRLRDWSTRKKG